VTASLRDAARLLGLPLLDHLILTARSHFSFREVEGWETDGATVAA
jgi:DNA repair protein RadC